MATKFAKKGHLIVDLTEDKPKMAKVGDKDLKSKKILKDANIEEAPEGVKPSKSKFTKETKPFVKAEKPAKEKATKAEKPAKEKAERGPDNRKLKLLVKENPKREGSTSYDRFEFYRGAKTVQAFLDAGGTLADVKHDEAKGYIEVA